MSNELHIPSFGTGFAAYEAAKRWIANNLPNLSPDQYALACAMAAKVAGV